MALASAVFALTNRVEVDLDLDPHVDACVPQQLNQTSESQFRVLFAINYNNPLATATQQLIDAQIFDMPAVGDVDVRVRPLLPTREPLATDTPAPPRKGTNRAGLGPGSEANTLVVH